MSSAPIHPLKLFFQLWMPKFVSVNMEKVLVPYFSRSAVILCSMHYPHDMIALHILASRKTQKYPSLNFNGSNENILNNE